MDNVAQVRGLTPAEIEQFITDGFVRIDHAFPRALADAALAILWKATGCRPDDPTTWTQPVIRLGMFTHSPFIEAANTPRLHAAFDQLVGPGRWCRPAAMGTFPVRFPSAVDPGDAGCTSTSASYGHAGLPVLACQHPLQGPRLADAVPVLRCRGARCAHTYPRRVTCGHSDLLQRSIDRVSGAKAPAGRGSRPAPPAKRP